MPTVSELYERIHKHPTLGPALDAVPAPVRLHDGRQRLGWFGLWRMARMWRNTPVLADEARAAYEAYSGGDVIDIGAFEGWYSVLLAPKSGAGDRFVSVEANTEAFPELARTLARLGRLFPGRSFVPIAAPAGDGRPVVMTRQPGGHPRFAVAEDGDGPPTASVDELVATLGLRPSFVKIDVEGAEPFVLAGLQRTLAEHGPVVALEVHGDWLPDGMTAADVEDMVARHGYEKRVLDVNEIAEHQLWTKRA